MINLNLMKALREEFYSNMGTRADFYVGKGATAEWIGSLEVDAAPETLSLNAEDPPEIFLAVTEQQFRDAVASKLTRENLNAVLPQHNWPWQYTNSIMSDYSYWFFMGKVWVSHFGSRFHGWHEYLNPSIKSNPLGAEEFPQYEIGKCTLLINESKEDSSPLP